MPKKKSNGTKSQKQVPYEKEDLAHEIFHAIYAEYSTQDGKALSEASAKYLKQRDTIDLLTRLIEKLTKDGVLPPEWWEEAVRITRGA